MEVQLYEGAEAGPRHAIIDVMARSSYEPTGDAAELFTKVKAARDALKSLSEALHETAIQEMREHGATVGDLSRLTGYDPEKYRRWARAAGIERRRPPTRGQLSDSSD
ncbi:hypothetical protein ACF06P_35635 [Streptomyces sp. NPDC015684]|uniref:hypothetical protein n=1 Tax=Streptomyces sp. NPDC015684 TaxID=3364963 RepID=UPI0036F868F6